MAFEWQGAENQYLDGLREILQDGVESADRTGVGTLSVFGMQKRYPLTKGFPLLTTKKVHFKSVVHELLWMLSGSTNIKYLQDNNVRIWNEWADEYGDLGPVYGHMWRKFPSDTGGIDQISNLIHDLKENPYSRRHIVTAWHPDMVEHQALPPCHCFMQFYVREGALSCQLYQRSADMFLGVPFNIASYSLLTHMIARECGLGVRDFVHTIGDAHIYMNHFEQVYEQLSRDPRELPELFLDPRVQKVDDFKFEHVKLLGYDPHPTIKADVAV